MAVALLKEPPLSPDSGLGPVLPEIHLDLSVLWKNVEERLSGR